MRRAGWLALGLVVATAPWIVAAVVPRQQRYVLHVLIFTALFAALALSYDLVVGHVGSLSLAHPAFFGVGAYTAAILATTSGWPFVADVGAAVVAAALVAALVGVPLFRLAEHAFAVGTLGLGLVASVVANNWVEVTRGPLCITGIPKPKLAGFAITTLPAYYWLALGALAGADLAPGDLRRAAAAGRHSLARRPREPAAARARPLMALLEVRGLTKRFLGVTAVDRVDLTVEPGELVSLIGPNGSGKTTLFNCVTGYLAADGGRALFRGHDLTHLPPHRVARLGLARTFQQVSVFARLSA